MIAPYYHFLSSSSITQIIRTPDAKNFPFNDRSYAIQTLHISPSITQIIRNPDVNLFRRAMEQFVDSRNSDAPGELKRSCERVRAHSNRNKAGRGIVRSLRKLTIIVNCVYVCMCVFHGEKHISYILVDAQLKGRTVSPPNKHHLVFFAVRQASFVSRIINMAPVVGVTYDTMT